MRRAAKWALMVLGILGVLVVVALGLLSNRDVTTRVAEGVIARFQKQIPVTIRFSHLSVNAARGQIGIDDLQLTIPGRPQEKFLATRQVIAQVAEGDLLRGKVTIKRLHLVDPQATIIHDGNNHYNFEALQPKQPQKKEEARSSLLSLEHVTLDGGRVTYLDSPRAVTAELPHIKGTFELDLNARAYAGQLSLSDGWVRYKEFKQPIESFAGDFKFAGEHLRVNKLKLDAGSTGLALAGDVGGLGGKPGQAQTLNLNGQLKTNLAQWASFAPKLELAGLAQADFQVAGTSKEPRVAADLHGEKLAAKGIHVADLVSRLSATRESVAIANLKAQIWGGTLKANGRVPLVKTAGLDLTATAEGLSLAAAQRELALKAARGIAGTVSARVHAAGPKMTPEALKAEGWVRTEGSFPVGGRPLPLAGRTDFRWADATLNVNGLQLQALGGRLNGRGQITPLAKLPRYSLNASLEGLELANLQPVLDRPLPASGRVSAEVSLAGRGFKTPELAGSGRVHAAGALKAHAAGNRVPMPVRADARLAFAGREIRLEDLTAALLGGQVHAQGRMALTSGEPDVHATAHVSGLDLAALNRTFAVAKGPLSGRVDAAAAFAGRTLTLESLNARTLGGVLAADGTVSLAGRQPRFNLKVRAADLDLQAANRAFQVARVPVAGTASARLTVSGVGNNFQATGPVTARGRAIVPAHVAGARRSVPFTLDAQVAAGPTAVALTPLNATLGSSTIHALGRLDLRGASNLVFNGQLQDAPALASILGVRNLSGGQTRFNGRVTGTAGALRLQVQAQAGPTRLDGKLAFQAAAFSAQGGLDKTLHLSGRLQASQASFSNQHVASLNSPFSYTAPRDELGKGTLRLPAIAAQLEHGRLAGNAVLDLGAQTYQADLHSSGVTLADIGALRENPPPGFPLQTPAQLHVTGAGSLKAPALTAHVDLGAFEYHGRHFGASRLDGHLRNGLLNLNGNLLGSQFGLAGDVAVSRAETGALTITFRDAQLAPLFALLPTKGEVELPSSGVLSGTVKLAGALSRPADLVATIDLTRLQLAYPDLAIANQGPLRMRYAARALTLEQFRLAGTDTHLVARGTVGLGIPSQLSFDGRVNLALLEKFAAKTFADAAGVAFLDGQLSGTLGAPDLTGALTIRNGEFQTRSLPQAIHDLNASVRLAQNRVFLDSLSATLGYTGRVQAYGGATLGPDFRPTMVNLQLAANEIQVRVPDTSALVSADLAFSGTPDASHLDGQVRILEGSYTKDIDLTGSLLKGRHGGAAAPPSFANVPFLKDLALRVQLLVPDQFTVKNNLADGDLRGDLLVLGTLARPVPVGRAEVLPGGTVTFQDRTYTLQEASVDFTDPNKLTPYMHVLANTSVQTYTVNVQVNGTPDALKVDLTSQPFLPQSDVLTLLATGQTPQQLGEAGTGGFAGAGNLLLNQVAKGVEHGVAKEGVVDVLKIQPGKGSGAEATGGSFTVGKRISDKLMVTYTQDLTSAPGQTPGRMVIFDYLLTDNIVINLQQDLSGGFNASARYRFAVR